MDRIFSPGEVAQRYAVSTKTVLLAIRRRELSAFQVNARVFRISETQVARWADIMLARAAGVKSEAQKAQLGAIRHK